MIQELLTRHRSTGRVDLTDIAEVVDRRPVSYEEVEYIIDRLESEADHVMRSAMAKLFRDEPDVKQVMKMRSVYEMLETVTDRCEDVANVIQGIVLENS